MNRIFVILFLLWGTVSAFAQNVDKDKAALLQNIEKNNTTLAALRQKAVAEKAGNSVGKAMPDPKVGYSHLWGSEPGSQPLKSFSIEQDLDWGTVSGLRGKTTRSENEVSDLNYLVERQSLLAEADILIVQLVYYNALCKEFDYRKDRAMELKNLYERKFAAGDANQLELNKVRLNYTSVVAEQRKAKADRDAVRDDLKRLNGNEPVDFNHSEYGETPMPPLAEMLQRAESEAPRLAMVKSVIERERRYLQLSKAEGLPSLSIGYEGEIENGENFNGISLGLSLPLWGNSRRKVKQQKAALLLAEYEQKDVETQVKSTLGRQYSNAMSLCQIAARFKQELRSNEDISILDKALQHGELSLIDYLNELSFYYSAHTQALEADRDSQLAVSEMWSMFR